MTKKYTCSISIRSIFLVSILTFSVFSYAADFKVDESKYEILMDGSVALKEFNKKATGTVTIPAQITDPKTKREYTLTQVANKAFKGSKATTVTLPSSVSYLGEKAFAGNNDIKTVIAPGVFTIGNSCFDDCANLDNVELSQVKNIGRNAFRRSGIKKIVFPGTLEKIGKSAFWDCEHLKSVTFEGGQRSIEIEPLVFAYAPIEEVYIDKKFIPISVDQSSYNGVELAYRQKNYKDKIFGSQDKLSKIILGPSISSFPEDLFFNLVQRLKSVGVPSADSYALIKQLNNLPYKFNIILNNRTMGKGEAMALAQEIQDEKDFWVILNNNYQKILSQKGSHDPLNKDLKEKFIAKHKDKIQKYWDVVCDSVYLQMEEIDDDDLQNIYLMTMDYLGFINVDNGADFLDWFVGVTNNDIIRKDIENGRHKDEYKRIKQLSDFYIDNDDNGHWRPMMMKITALCGESNWKEAAQLYPILYKAVVEYEKAPVFMDYYKNLISEHGYKVKDPVNKKNEYSNKDLFNDLLEGAIGAGVDRMFNGSGKKLSDDEMLKEIDSKSYKRAKRKARIKAKLGF